mgnify:CR=1 FL=1
MGTGEGLTLYGDHVIWGPRLRMANALRGSATGLDGSNAQNWRRRVWQRCLYRSDRVMRAGARSVPGHLSHARYRRHRDTWLDDITTSLLSNGLQALRVSILVAYLYASACCPCRCDVSLSQTSVC